MHQKPMNCYFLANLLQDIINLRYLPGTGNYFAKITPNFLLLLTGGHPHLPHPFPDPALQPPHPQDLLRRDAGGRPLRLPPLRHLHDPHVGDLEDVRQGDCRVADAGGVCQSLRGYPVSGLSEGLPRTLPPHG